MPFSVAQESCGTRARVLLRTLVHWNIKNETRQRNEIDDQSKYGKEYSGHEINKSQRPNTKDYIHKLQCLDVESNPHSTSEMNSIFTEGQTCDPITPQLLQQKGKKQIYQIELEARSDYKAQTIKPTPQTP